MEWLVIGFIAWQVLKHNNLALGGFAGGVANGPVLAGTPLAPPAGGTGVAPNQNTGILPPGMASGDVVGANQQQYGRGFGNNVGQTTAYPAGPRPINYIPVSNPLGGALTTPPPSADQTSGPQPDQGYVIGRGY